MGKLSDYYSEMRNKYGFNEGQTPEGIEKVRDLIIKKVNAKIKKVPKLANVKLIEFDRPGFHNWCLIEFWHIERNELWDPSEELLEFIAQVILDLDQEYDITEKVIIRPMRILEEE